MKNVVKHVLPQELLLYLERVTGLLRGLLLTKSPPSIAPRHALSTESAKLVLLPDFSMRC